MNRRPSYASVAAGASNRTGMLTSSRSRTSSNDSESTAEYPLDRDPDARPAPITASSPQQQHRTATAQMATASSHQESAGPPLEPNQLAPFWNNGLLKDRNLAIYGRHTTMSGLSLGGSDRFIMPSYLQGSRYMARAVQRQTAKEAAARREISDTGIRPSRSSSSIDITSKRLSSSSYHGVSYTSLEDKPAANATVAGASNIEVDPLPSRWMPGQLEVIADGTGLLWPPQSRTGEQETACALTDNPIPVSAGLYYYELHVEQHPKDGHLAVGFSHEKIAQYKLPGWEHRSWGWHSDDGKKYTGQQAGTSYWKEWGKNDIVGCGINFWDKSIFFTKNGVRLNDAFLGIEKGDIAKIYPCIGMRAPGATIRANFGQEAFKYDVQREIQRFKGDVNAQYMDTKLSRLTNGKNENDFVKELVAQFLRHGGYVETARAFISEVQAEHDALGTGWRISGNAAAEDIDAAQRQQIRSAILTGDVEKAIRCTADFYPRVLVVNPIIDFRLKCRRFLEMVKRHSPQPPSTDAISVSPSKKVRAAAALPGHSGAMELDDPIEGSGVPPSSEPMDLQAVIDEGSRLRAEYGEHPSREVREMMRHIMGIWAYEDPTTSKEVGHLFKQAERVKVAEELNGAILESMGKSSVAAVERMAQQTEVLVEDITGIGLPGAFMNLETDIFR